MIVDCYHEACVCVVTERKILKKKKKKKKKKKMLRLGIIFFQIGKKVTLIPLGKGTNFGP